MVGVGWRANQRDGWAIGVSRREVESPWRVLSRGEGDALIKFELCTHSHIDVNPSLNTVWSNSHRIVMRQRWQLCLAAREHILKSLSEPLDNDWTLVIDVTRLMVEHSRHR